MSRSPTRAPAATPAPPARAGAGREIGRRPVERSTQISAHGTTIITTTKTITFPLARFMPGSD
jgi:hypothetical protein